MTPTITTGDFYCFSKSDDIWIVTAISDRIHMTRIFDHFETSLFPQFVTHYGRYLGNVSTTPISQLKDFYPELFI